MIKSFLDLITQTVEDDLLKSVYGSLILGSTALDFKQKQIFTTLGIVHVLVISGLHINTLFQLIGRILRVPLGMIYMGGLCRSKFCHTLEYYFDFVSLVFLWIFTWLCSFSAPCVRATLFISCTVILKHTGFELSRYRLCAIVASVQLLLFRENFFSFSNFLSWTIYLILKIRISNSNFLNTLVCQFLITILCTYLFRTYPLAGLIINLILQKALNWFIISLALQTMLLLARSEITVLMSLQEWFLAQLVRAQVSFPGWYFSFNL